MRQALKSIITGKELQYGELERDWQEFIEKRQDRLEEKIHIEKLSGEYSKKDKRFNEILVQLCNNDLAEIIRETAFAKERTANYIFYNCGFREGLKLALTLCKL